MRAGWVVSLIGHVGFVIMTMLAWNVSAPMRGGSTPVVPIEIVDVAVEANVRAMAQEVEDPAEEDVADPENRTVEPQPAPAPAPTPAPRRPTPPQDVFDPTVAGNLAGAAQRRRREGEPADRNQEGAGPATGEQRTTLEARIAQITRAELIRCWRTVADMPEPERMVVVLSVRLNRDGSLNGQPRVVRPTNYTFDPLMNEAVNRALRAVRTCEPIERLPDDPIVGEHFDLWRDQEVTFGIRQ